MDIATVLGIVSAFGLVFVAIFMGGGIQLFINKILILECHIFKFHRKFKERVLNAQLAKHFMACLTPNFGTGVEVLGNAMAKPEQTEGIIAIAGTRNEFGDIILMPDLVQHVQHSLVGATMCRPPKRGNAGGNTCKGIGP